MRIDRNAAEQIQKEARRGYPFEVCGIMLAERRVPAAGSNGARPVRVVRVVPVENRETEKPRVRYVIAPEDQLRVQRESRAAGLEIVGYYHSHPDHPARPSETDRRIAAESISDGVLHVIVGVEGGDKTTPRAWIYRDRLEAFEAESFDVE